MRSIKAAFISFIILFSPCVSAADALTPIEIRLSGHTTTKNLPVIQVDQAFKDVMQARLDNIKSIKSQGEHLDLTMNNVPVFDQGMHGTCATFALTAAIDASLYHSDRMSQLCLLQLQRSLNQTNQTLFPTVAWEGTMVDRLYHLIVRYGYIPKTRENEAQCGGLSAYPNQSADTGSPMYLQFYSGFNDRIYQTGLDTLLSTQEAFSLNTDTHDVLQNIKTALKKKQRVVVGLAFDPSFNSGFVGKTKVPFDTWIITPSLKQKISSGDYEKIGFHAVVIYGYDDEAVVSDQDGQRINQGVFKLRNSWGEYFGDKGDGYVTYDYLQLMIAEAQAVIHY